MHIKFSGTVHAYAVPPGGFPQSFGGFRIYRVSEQKQYAEPKNNHAFPKLLSAALMIRLKKQCPDEPLSCLYAYCGNFSKTTKATALSCSWA